jgi:hypothetical protein
MQPEAVAVLLVGEAELEEALHALLRDPDAVVLDLDLHALAEITTRTSSRPGALEALRACRALLNRLMRICSNLCRSVRSRRICS